MEQSKNFYYLRNILSPLSGKAGEFYFWFYKTWHGRLPNKSRELYINFLSFFPKGTDRVQMLKECNEERVEKISSNYIKKLLNNYKLSKEIGPSKDLECMKIEKFNFKNIFNSSFIICLLKILIFEILFFPVRVLRIIRKMIKKHYQLFKKNRPKSLILIFVGSLIAAIFEMASIGSLPIFVGFISSPGNFY